MANPIAAATRAEAERLLGVSEKLLQNRDLRGARDFAILAQETEPLLEGPDQILAVTEVLLAGSNRINNNQFDWYAILQVDRRSDDLETVKRQYRRLALLLHPDKNRFPFSDSAFKLVSDAWVVLSDSLKKSVYDNQINYFFTRIDLANLGNNQYQAPINREHQIRPNLQSPAIAIAKNKEKLSNAEGENQFRPNLQPPAAATAKKMKSKEKLSHAEDSDTNKGSTFWTACPYCYVLYEYPNAYNECCLRCQKCQKAFQAVSIPSLPPLIPGKEAYNCCWGYFPLGFSTPDSDGGGGKFASAEFPNWMPPMFSPPPQPSGFNVANGNTKKRGRP